MDEKSATNIPVKPLPNINARREMGVTFIAPTVLSIFSSTIFMAISIPASIEIKSSNMFTSIFFSGGTVLPNSIISERASSSCTSDSYNTFSSLAYSRTDPGSFPCAII